MPLREQDERPPTPLAGRWEPAVQTEEPGPAAVPQRDCPGEGVFQRDPPPSSRTGRTTGQQAALSVKAAPRDSPQAVLPLAPERQQPVLLGGWSATAKPVKSEVSICRHQGVTSGGSLGARSPDGLQHGAERRHAPQQGKLTPHTHTHRHTHIHRHTRSLTHTRMRSAYSPVRTGLSPGTDSEGC